MTYIDPASVVEFRILLPLRRSGGITNTTTFGEKLQIKGQVVSIVEICGKFTA